MSETSSNPESNRGTPETRPNSPETNGGVFPPIVEKRETETESLEPEKKSLFETLKNLESDDARKEFLMKLQGRRVYHFATNEEGVKDKQYLKLKDEKISKGQKQLTFEVYNLDGKRVLNENGTEKEITQQIAKIKYRHWGKVEPAEIKNKVGKITKVRDNEGKLNDCRVEEGVEADEGPKYIFKNEPANEFENLRVDQVVKYDYKDKDGNEKTAYARRTEPRPELKKEKENLEKEQKEELKKEYIRFMAECMFACNNATKEFEGKKNEEKVNKYFQGILDKLNIQSKIEVDRLSSEKLKKNTEQFKKWLEASKEKLEEYRKEAKDFKSDQVKTESKREEEKVGSRMSPLRAYDKLEDFGQTGFKKLENFSEKAWNFLRIGVASNYVLDKLDQNPKTSTAIGTTIGGLIGIFGIGGGPVGILVGGTAGIASLEVIRYFRRLYKEIKKKDSSGGEEPVVAKGSTTPKPAPPVSPETINGSQPLSPTIPENKIPTQEEATGDTGKPEEKPAPKPKPVTEVLPPTSEPGEPVGKPEGEEDLRQLEMESLQKSIKKIDEQIIETKNNLWPDSFHENELLKKRSDIVKRIEELNKQNKKQP